MLRYIRVYTANLEGGALLLLSLEQMLAGHGVDVLDEPVLGSQSAYTDTDGHRSESRGRQHTYTHALFREEEHIQRHEERKGG